MIIDCISAVRNVNSSLPQEIRSQRVVKVDFEDELFQVNSLNSVTFLSNCTESVTVDYSNPLLITIPDTGLNTGQCHYSIQLVDSNSQQIGYSITGFFEAECNDKCSVSKF